MLLRARSHLDEVLAECSRVRVNSDLIANATGRGGAEDVAYVIELRLLHSGPLTPRGACSISLQGCGRDGSLLEPCHESFEVAPSRRESCWFRMCDLPQAFTLTIIASHTCSPRHAA